MRSLPALGKLELLLRGNKRLLMPVPSPLGPRRVAQRCGPLKHVLLVLITGGFQCIDVVKVLFSEALPVLSLELPAGQRLDLTFENTHTVLLLRLFRVLERLFLLYGVARIIEFVGAQIQFKV